MSIRSLIGQLILIGFEGIGPDDIWPIQIRKQLEAGELGGVVFYRHNFVSKQQTQEFVHSFAAVAAPHPVIRSLDQEGGRVFRLSPDYGFENFLGAKDVAASMDVAGAREYYRHLGETLAENGFNLNFAPCVDIDHDPPSPVIGGFGRAYSDDVSRVTEYARAFLDGMKHAAVLSCLKHYPGHGSAQGDTHKGLIDVTDVWSERELEPYKSLAPEAPCVMTSHLMHQKVDPKFPVTLSAAWLRKLREETGFQGVIITDDMHMGAMLQNFGMMEACVQALAAGCDLLCLSNNPLAAQGVDGFKPDADLPVRVADAVEAAVRDGRLSEQRIRESYDRVVAMKGAL